MPEDVTAELLAAPSIEDFVGHRPIYVDASTAFPVVKTSSKRSDLLTVYGPDRLFWINVYKESCDNKFNAFLSTAPKNQSSVLCYWLPWRADGTVRIRLRPSKKYGTPLKSDQLVQSKKSDTSAITTGDVKGASINRPEIDPNQAGEPRLFFTAFMDGCSTWIAGQPSEPIVYHINRAAGSSKAMKKFEKIPDLYDRESAAHQANTKTMTHDFKRVWKMEKSDDRLDRSGSGRAKQSLVGVGVTPAGQKIHHMGGDKWRDQMVAQTGVNPNLRVYNQKTGMFGVKRADGGWKFFTQDIFECKQTDNTGNVFAGGNVLYIAGRPVRVFPI